MLYISSMVEDMEIIEIIIIMLTGFWLFIPAMVPNLAAAIFGGGACIDFGKSWRYRRILGEGKTWRGFIGGVLSGILVGTILMWISGIWDPINHWGYGQSWESIGIISCLAIGALLGDMVGAFIKRRFGLRRGEKAILLDQYDFVIGAFLFTSIFYSDWIYSTYIEGWNIMALIFILLLMFVIHRVMNIVGYKLGIKKEPW